jgi:hypothetical protein
VFARQVLYHFSHTLALFALVILEIGSCFLSGPDWTSILLFMLPAVAGMTGTCYNTLFAFFCCNWVSRTFFAQVGLES